MPWKECNRVDERLRFVARLLDGEKMAVVCREFGISRKTGYKIFNHYKDEGLSGLEDRARSPYRHPNKLPFQVETVILRIKREHTSWSAPKIREKLAKAYPMISLPAASTIHVVLDYWCVRKYLPIVLLSCILWLAVFSPTDLGAIFCMVHSSCGPSLVAD